MADKGNHNIIQHAATHYILEQSGIKEEIG